MKTIFCIIASLLLGFGPALTVTQTQAPGPANPYCGKTPSDFNPAVPLCGEGNSMDQGCLGTCKTTYKNAMVAASNAACSQYDTANSQFVGGIDFALATFDQCMGNAITQADRAVCRSNCAALIEEVTSNLFEDRTAIADGFSTASATVSAAFVGCALGCCHPN